MSPRTLEHQRHPGHGRRVWLRGGIALAADAFTGSVTIVNGVHRAITRTVTRLNPAALPVAWSSDFVYARVRDVGRLSFFGISQAAGLAETLLPARPADIPARTSHGLRSALNGAFGDTLARKGNDLALPMALVDADGRTLDVTPAALAAMRPNASRRLVVLVHGLGMNDQQWRQAGRAGFGERLAQDFGYTALRLRYNSGRHISENGRELADLLDALIAAWPVVVERLTIIGHSMGGLVARSACHYGRQAGHDWVDALQDLVCLGSPHLGAPLERLGNTVTWSLTRIPYTKPLAAIGEIRSAGVKDLRYGYVIDDDWRQHDAAGHGYTPAPLVAAPDHVGHYLVAATLGRRHDDPLGRWLGDLLVPVTSAVAHSSVPSRRLPDRNQDGRVFYGMNHLALIHHNDVYEAIAEWLAPRLKTTANRPGRPSSSNRFLRNRRN